MSQAFNHSNIGEFFKNKSVFITGVTGLVGKVLAEKILRSCTDVQYIYLLIRPKRGKTVEQRFHELITKSRGLFTFVDKNFLEKLIPIDGDVSLPGLGMSDRDKQIIIKNVSIVFHAAADITFESKDLR